MRALSPIALALMLGLTLGAAPAGKTLVVVGQNDVTVDRPAIQAAIDAAPKNGTVRLVGTFQLDGQELFVSRGHITIEGERIDDDGDGKVNEDWIDGLDNDFDGAIDEDDWDTLLRGLVRPDGLPEGVDDIRSRFNRGIAVTLIEGSANQITLRDLHFDSLVRGVGLEPDSFIAPGFRCADVVVTGGSADNAVIERNRFTNSTRGPQIFGAAHNATIRHNVIEDVTRDLFGGGGQAIILVGDAAFCVADDGSGSSYEIGQPIGARIEGNRIVRASRYGVGAFETVRARIVGNEVVDTTGAWGVLFRGDRTEAIHNVVDGGAEFGILAWQANPGGQIKNNAVSNVRVGIEVDGSEVRAHDNATSGNELDYELSSRSFDNRYHIRAGQTCLDRGTDNRVTGGACPPPGPGQ